MRAQRSAQTSRRAFLTLMVTGAGATLLAACAPAAPRPAATAPPAVAAQSTAAPATAAPTQAAAAATAAPTTTAPAPAAAQPPIAPTQAAPAQSATAAPKLAASKGELRVAIGNDFPATLDATKNGATLIFTGAGETLMRMSPQLKLEPWLASGISNVDPLTWRVTLRQNATFWDGSPVDAEAVVASLKRSWDLQPGADLFIPKATEASAVDRWTVQLKTPAPSSDLPASLLAQFFVIHKPGGENASIMTGPYRPVDLQKDEQVTLEAFAGHWAGPPLLARAIVKQVVDANARGLGLQAGDLDMVYGLPPTILKTLGPDLERVVRTSTRIHFMYFNHARPLFGDKALREATALAIDRQELNTVGLDGLGAPAFGLYPSGLGIEVVEGQKTDVTRAKSLLDAAGWTPGADGVRAKGGQRLAFTIHSWPGRGELTPMAVAISGQLKPLGYEVQIQEVRDIRGQMKSGDFDAAMFSNNVFSAGPLRIFSQTLVKGGADNYGGYTNPRVEELIGQIRGTFDPAAQQSLLRQAQELVLADAANAYLVATPGTAAYRKSKVAAYELHPSDLYFLDRTLVPA